MMHWCSLIPYSHNSALWTKHVHSLQIGTSIKNVQYLVKSTSQGIYSQIERTYELSVPDKSGGAPGPELRTTALDKVGWQGTMWTNRIKKEKKKKKRRMCIAYTHTVCGEMCNLHCVRRRFSAPVVAKAQSAVWLL